MELSKVYLGGNATGVQCAAPTCRTISTSGSWRRGWPLEDGSKCANLCNRCGQRWSKDKRGFHDQPQEPQDGVKLKKRSQEAQQSSPPSSQKRLKEPPCLESNAPSASQPGDSPYEHTRTTKPAVAANGVKFSMPGSQQQQQQQLVSQVKQSFVSYTIQKLSSSRGNHALFWLQDVHGQHTLAVVGTDARLSGHFTYATTPDFSAAPPLRCTNRTEVTQWLASFGVTELLVENGAPPLPQLDAAEKKRLLTGEPVWAKPQIDMGAWQAVKEESGRLTDGRHFKRFFLLDEAGQEKLAVTGLDSMRKDRRYKYFAEDCMGGFAFENSREVLDWLNFILDRPADNPIQPQQVRAPLALTETQLGTAAASKQPALTVRVKPTQPRPTAMNKEGEQEAMGGSRTQAGKRESGANCRQDSEGDRPEGCGAGTLGLTPEALAAAAAPRPPACLAHFGGKVRPQPLSNLRFRCACCGMADHDSSDCLLAATSPTTLIRRPTLDKGVFQDPSLMSHLSAAHGPLLALPGPSTPAAPMTALGGAAVSNGSGGVLQYHAGERSITPAVKAAYQDFPRLQQWVAATPSAHTVETFRAWADRLGGHISNEAPAPSNSPEEEPLGGWRWVPTAEALAILNELSMVQVNLALLESTGISRAVAMLRTHKIDAVAKLAEVIVAKWRACAVAALHHATAALEHTA